MRFSALFVLLLYFNLPGSAQEVIPGAARMDVYLPLLLGKNIALVGNHTSQIGSVHLLDTLLRSGVNVLRVFSPEHGFRGDADAGASVSTAKDARTGIPVISLYGKKFKPQAAELKGVDLVLFDLQDVGVRFYTYLSTLHYVMEACAENHVPLVVLDRPNPNGSYIDGPVLEKQFSSFVGLHPVPVVYGMTIGEYAMMVNGEGWLKKELKCDLQVITCLNYTHASLYQLPLKPSPNLPDMLSVYLYPSLAFFEGTDVSVGRGTLVPFKVYGSPRMEGAPYSFTPVIQPGMSKNPMYKEVACYGWDLTRLSEKELIREGRLNLVYLLNAYKHTKNKNEFFNSYFNLLAGTAELQNQVKQGVPEDQIRQSWEPGLSRFKEIRSRYLLYP
jgi:uncharacterized protein YbbC (DUF1343 family)